MKNKILFLILLLPLMSSAQIYVKPGLPGHSFVKSGNTYYSFGNYNAKGVGKIFSHQGVIQQYKNPPKGCHEYSAKVDTGKLKELVASPPKYRLFRYNCTHFVQDVTSDKDAHTPLGLEQTLKGGYRITWKKVALFSLMGFSGALHGAREAYHADPTVFERHFNAHPYGFGGSHEWERKYVGNRYKNDSGTPRPMKSQVFGNFGRDYWHTARYLNHGVNIGVSITIGASKQPLKHKIIDGVLAFATHELFSSLTYKTLRK